MQEIIEFNRKTLKSVDKWILEKDYKMPPSLFNYGLPPHVFHLIDQPIDSTVSEVDYLCHLMKLMNRPVRYLEIGVSVGKNMYTMVRFAQEKLGFGSHTISGIDIEKINPTFNNLLEATHTVSKIESFPNGKPTSIRNSAINVKHVYSKGTMVTSYYEADEFSDVWTMFDSENPFNLVFSDALHEPRALLHEYFSLKENKLLDTVGGFYYCFDDLEPDENTGGMWSSVHRIVDDIKDTFGNKLDVKLQHHEMNAWLGQHEHKHHFGVISAFPRVKIL